jgi:hypothetical protein
MIMARPQHVRRYNLSMEVHVFVYDQVYMAEMYHLRATFDPAPLFQNKSDVIGRLWNTYSTFLLQRTLPFNDQIILLARVVYVP